MPRWAIDNCVRTRDFFQVTTKIWTLRHVLKRMNTKETANLYVKGAEVMELADRKVLCCQLLLTWP